MDTVEAPESRALREARALARLSIAVARASTTRAVAEILLDELHAVVPSATAALALLADAGHEFQLIGVRSSTTRTVNVHERWPADMPSPARDVVRAMAPFVIDLQTYRERYEEVSRISDPTGIVTYAALPIIAGNEAIGAVGLSWGTDPELDDADLLHLQALVDAGAQALGRARLEDATRRTRDLMAAMVDQVPLGVLILERGGATEVMGARPVYMNEAFFEIFGLSRRAEPGQPLTQVQRMDGTPSPEDERPLVRATFRGEVVRDELYRLLPPGLPPRVVSVNAGPVRDPGGEIIAGVALYADVTARLETEAAREAFLGVLSHELRTPITSLLAATDLLLRRWELDASSRELVEGLADDANRLHRLVENLLVLSRVERGADLSRDDPVLLHHVVRGIVAREQTRWPAIRFEVEAPTTLPVIASDESYVEQIVQNLMSNAAKYGAASGVVRLRLDETGDEVRLRVLDDGPGFQPGDEERVFDLFYRHESAARIAPGAGIGLFAVRALASATGGRAWARTRPEGGAEVGVGWPVAAVERRADQAS